MAIVKVKVWDIDWDTDGEKVPELPNEASFEMKDDGFGISDEDIADELSDEYGYCVNAFYCEITDQDGFELDRFGERVNEIEGKVS